MAEIASIFLSPLIQGFFDKMASGVFVDFFRRQKLSDELLKQLKTTFLTLSAVLEDAEELQVTNSNVKEWLDELKDAVYDAGHVLDEIATQALQSNLEAQFPTTTCKVRKSISTSLFVKKIEIKIKEVLRILESLAQQKNAIGLTEGGGVKSFEIFATSSLIEESDICGRNDEKDAIIKLLLSNEVRGNEMGVIAIVGMGGIGKTTLAQLVYNDKRVKEYFDLDAWVYVSKEVDVTKVTKKIMEGLSLPTRDITDLNQLQVTLKKELTGKKFLIVLDDVWNENYVNWEDLSKPFKSGAKESRVIVTTRDHEVALVMRAISVHPLEKLPEEDCWSLFTKHAFHDGNPKAHQHLEELGRQIVEKCDGLPLAVKAIGDLLRYKLDVDEWNKILKSDLWDSPIDKTKILPALRLSYKYLPSHLKWCFAYCSIFPKDYVFKKREIVLLWMAEGFLHESKNKTMEEVGDDYFFALVSRSLLQQLSGNTSLFTMHDLVNDLATFVSGKFNVRMEGDYYGENASKVRHLSYVRKGFDGFKKFEALYKAKKLCTFLPMDLSRSYLFYLTKKVPHELLPMLKCLRVLSLSLYDNMTELPESIGKLKLLRYLDLSSTEVQKLPDSICKLCNLQTLILSWCVKLTALPTDMWKLISLRHLDITKTKITEMPIHLGRLKCLQTLTKFIVGKGSGACVGELENFTNLQGSLSILELQNVESPTNALNARLGDKKYLEELVLEWNVDTNFSESHRSVLDSLQPHTNLKSLTIKYYGGKSFSNWVGHPSFSNVASLKLQNCRYCSILPPLGQLPSLQSLSIVGFNEVVRVGPEFCGTGGSSSLNSFDALKVLTFEHMAKWEEWVSENEGVDFPQLEQLYIKDCPVLKGGLPVHLPSLTKLQIYKCQQLVAPLPKTPAIGELELTKCNKMVLKELPTGMKKLVLNGLEEAESIPEGMIESIDGLQELVISCCSLTSLRLPSTLKTLNISGCNSLQSLRLPSALETIHIAVCNSLEPIFEGTIDSNSCLQKLSIHHFNSLEGRFPSTLKTFEAYNFRRLELPAHVHYSSLETLTLSYNWDLDSFPLDLFPKLYQLTFWGCYSLKSLMVPENYEHDLVLATLKIELCENFVYFPNGGLRGPSLTSLSIIECKSLRSLPEKMDIFFPSLEVLRISQCPKIESLPEEGLPSSLKSIEIERCEKLIVSRMGWGSQNLPILTNLTICGNHEDVESFPEAQLLPTSLTFLSISDFPNLKSLEKNGLQHLRALKGLKISNCPKLKHMPDKELPASLSILKISDCPLLTKKWQGKRKGKEWRKVAHIERKRIDNRLVE